MAALDNFLIIIAAWYGHMELLDVLLNRGANIETLSCSGETPLIYAAQNGHTGIVRTLLKKGANIEAVKTETALMVAARNGHNVIVGLLLKRGAKIEAEDSIGETALFKAVTNGHPKTVDMLLDWGADVTASTSLGTTALMVAAASNQKGSSQIVKILLEGGASVNKVNKGEWTALIFASYNGNVDIVSLLLERGATVDNRAKRGGAAIDSARQQGCIEVVQLLTAHAEVVKAVRMGSAVARAKMFIEAGTRPYLILSLPLLARCLGLVQAAELAGWASAQVADNYGCFVALFEGSGRVEGCLVSLRRCTALHVHYPAKRRIMDFLVFKLPATRALLRLISRGLVT